MIKKIAVKEGVKLKDYDLYSSLAMALRELRQEASMLIPKLKGKKVWMINSTAQGGGVAEMMPRLISLFRQLGVECEWIVATTQRKEFFKLTKKIHNLIHGEQKAVISDEEKILYEKVNQENADELLELISPNDIVVIHDPQPMGMGMFIKQKMNIKLVWRCHIGFDKRLPQTETAWQFLKPYAEVFSNSVFSAPEYIPSYLAGQSTVIYPSIDPLDHKNRDLPIHKVVGVLCNSNLVTEYHPVLTSSFPETAKKLQPDGNFNSPLKPKDIGLLFKPVLLQVSRWDRLKGFEPLIKGFTELKMNMNLYANSTDRNIRRIQLAHLVLAGPDPALVEDDPEGRQVLDELAQLYLSLHPSIQSEITLLKLPMTSRKHNDLMVNALQRVASMVLQNSLKEGFGLTVTEAMWKIKPVIGSNSCGIRHQIQDHLDGLLIFDPLNKKEIAAKINYCLANPKESEVWGYHGQKNVIENFLIFTQIRKWLELLTSLS